MWDELKSYEFIAIFQSLYFLATGVWSLVGIKSFMKATGPKRDIWLVKTVGVLVSVIALSILAAVVSRSINSPTMVLAAGSAAALGIIDVYYVVKKVISPIYLLDAFIELILVALWLFMF